MIDLNGSTLISISTQSQAINSFRINERIAFIGNYLPRLCGIATFTTDLCESISDEYKGTAYIAIPVNDTQAGCEYPARVRLVL